MNHETYERLLPALVEGDLGDAERAELEGHLAECVECAEWRSAYDTLAASVDRARRRLADRHPSSEDLARYAVCAAELEPEACGELEEHLEQCSDCRGDLGLVEQAVEAARQPSESKAGAERRIPAWWSWAAALLVAVAGALLLLARPAPPPETVHLPRRSIDADSTFEASKDVVAEQVALESGAVLRLKAGETVAFGEGFSVDRDAEMIVEVSPAEASDTAKVKRAQT